MTESKQAPKEFLMHKSLGHSYNLDEIPDYRDKNEYIHTVEYKAYEAEKQKVLELISELKRQNNSALEMANIVRDLNMKTHGDLYGCDCEAGCNCKPQMWYELEKLKYHFLGSSEGLKELINKYGGSDE